MNPPLAISRRRVQQLLVLSITIACFALSPLIASAGLRQSGRWTDKYDFFTNAVNLATLRGTNDTTQVLYWSLPESAFVWNPSTGGSIAPRRFPASTNLFCSGQSTLSDGRLLVVGGDDMGSIGPRSSEIFNARDRTWTVGPTMADGRYYATAVTVGRDTVFAFSGAMFNQFMLYGGRTGGSVVDSLHVLGMGVPPHWKSPISTSPTLPAREGHTAVYWTWQHRMYTFGGKNGSTVYNDVHALQYWRYAHTVEDSFTVTTVTPIASSGSPAARWRHSMVLYPKSNTEVEIYVYGGLGQDSTVKSDVWRLRVNDAGAAYWEPVTTSGSGPGARYGHAAVYDRGAPGTNRPRMLVFGGRNSTSTAPEDSAVYELTLTGTPTWSTLVLRSGSPIPAARESLVMIADRASPRERRESTVPLVKVDENRIVMWGGRNANGIIPQDDVWMLWLPDSAWAATNSSGPQWQATTPTADATYGRPAHRLGMAGGHETAQDFFVFAGGDTAAGSARDVWAFIYRNPQGDEVPSWERLFPDYQIGSRAGHTFVEGSGISSKFPERTNSSLTSWTKLATAGRASGQLYPQVFQLPGGRLAMVGEDSDTQILNLGTGLYERRTSGYTTTGVLSGSSVMYRPGKILKCGFVPATTVEDSIPKKIIFGSDADTSSGWTNTNSGFLNRTCHNMVVLPTGEVLVTGGTRPAPGEHYAAVNPSRAVYRPQMWNPNTGAWSDTSTLARDPAMRDYHSSAVLLSDGRVLTAGGASKANVDWRKAAIYSPYYVFARKDSTTDSTLATRPAIDDLLGDISYGSTFRVCTVGKASSVAMVSLIKPGASTHGYNSDQRFVPLTFSTVGCSNTRELSVGEPDSRFIAPAGDYMLFIVASDSTPSVARWVRVGDERGETEPTCLDYCGGEASELTTGTGGEESLSILTRAAAEQFGEDLVPIDLAGGAKETVLKLAGPEDGCLILQGVTLKLVEEPVGWRVCSVDGSLRATREIKKLTLGPWRAFPVLDTEEEQPAPVDTVLFDVASEQLDRPQALTLNWKAGTDGWAQAPSEVQTQTSGSGWTNVRTIYAQDNWLEQCVPISSNVTQVRVIFRGRPQVSAASFVELIDLPVPPVTISPDAVTGGPSPALAHLLEGKGNGGVKVCQGSKVSAHFSLPSWSVSRNQRWFVDVRGKYESTSNGEPGPKGSDALSLAVANPAPNPSFGRTFIAFTLSRREHATIRVYGVAGRLVRELLDEPVDGGRHELLWDGLDRSGRKVAPGVYFYRVTAGSLKSEKKVVLLR